MSVKTQVMRIIYDIIWINVEFKNKQHIKRSRIEHLITTKLEA